jgi:tetratricopeptide (TPR) repeat protein
MKREFNVPFFAMLIGGLAFLAVGVHFLHGYQVKRNAKLLLDQAHQAEEKDQLNQASELLGTYLAYVPDDQETLVEYGFLLEKMSTGNPGLRVRAFLVLEKALRLDPDKLEVRRKAARVAMDLGRFTDALEHLKFLPDGPEVKQLTGQCQESESEFEFARTSYQDALRQDPKQIQSYLSLAVLLHRRLNLPSEAEKVMDDLVANNAYSFRAFLARADYFKEIKEPKPAGLAIDNAQKLAPDESDVILAAAELKLASPHSANVELKETRALLQHGLQLYPQNVRMYLLMAQLEEQSHHQPEAIAVLRQGAKAIPGNPNLLWSLADLLLAQGETAEEEITRLRQLGVSPARLDFLQARALMRDGKWWEAIRTLERIRPDFSTQPDLLPQIDLNLGLAYGQVGDADQQYAAFRHAAEADPALAAAHLGMASALLAIGRTQEAIDLSRKAVAVAPGAAIEVARLMILKNLRLPEQRRQWDDVDRVLSDCGRLKPAPSELPILEAESLAGRGEFEKARNILEQARAKGPDRVELWTALANLADRENSGRPLTILDEAQAKFGDKVEIRLARAAYWAKRKGESARQALARLEPDARQTDLSADDQAKLLRGLARAYGQFGDLREAGRILKRLGNLRPWDLGIRLVLLDLALQEGDESALLSTIQHLNGLEGSEGVWWQYARACYLIWKAEHKQGGQLEEADQLLTEVAKRRPTCGRIPRRQGEIDDLRGEVSLAIKNYLRAVDLGERDPSLIRRTVELLSAQNRYPEAYEIIQLLPETAPVSADLQRLAAQVFLQVHDFSRARELAQKAVSEQSKEFRDHLWLGQILYAVSQAKKMGPAEKVRLAQEAEKALRQAVKLGGDVPDPWVTLISFLARTGLQRDAETALQEMERKFSPNKASLPLAYCYEAIGQTDKARHLYKDALKTSVESKSKDDRVFTLRAVASFFLRTNQVQEAEPLLQHLISLKTEAPEDAAWAKRILGIVLGTKGDYQHAREALALLGILEEGDGTLEQEASEDLRAKALVLASQSRSTLRRRAIPVLEKLMERQPTPEDQFLLGQLYEGAGDWPKAKLRFANLVANNGDNPKYLASYALALLRQDELAESQICLERLERLPEAIDSFALTEVKSRLLAARHNTPEAVAQVRFYVDSKTSKSDDSTERLQNGALLLESLHQAFPTEKDFAANAEKLYRESILHRPEKALLLVSFLGRQGRRNEALDLCAQAWQKCPPIQVALTTMTVLHQGSVDSAQYDRVDGWFREAMVKDPKAATAIMVFQADLRLLQSRYADAVAIYRRVLERDSHNATALNNLAWILALKQGKGAEALELAEQALQIIGPNPSLLDTRGVIYLSLGRVDQAVQDLEAALEEKPTATYCFHLARALAKAKNVDRAKEAFRRAKELGLTPNSLDPLEREEYAKLGMMAAN